MVRTAWFRNFQRRHKATERTLDFLNCPCNGHQHLSPPVRDVSVPGRVPIFRPTRSAFEVPDVHQVGRVGLNVFPLWCTLAKFAWESGKFLLLRRPRLADILVVWVRGIPFKLYLSSGGGTP